MAEQRSWRNPGRVSSAVRQPPPMVSSASSTWTDQPDSASSTAAARPFGPDPTTTASYRPALLTIGTLLGPQWPDDSMQVEWLTEAFALTFEVDPDQPSELGVLSAVHPEDRAEADRGVEMVRAGREFLAELRLRTRTGRPVWTLCYARPVMDRDTGRLVRVNGAVRDI